MYFLALFAAVAVSASPVQLEPRTTTLKLSYITKVTDIKNLVAKGQARLHAVNANTTASSRFSNAVSSGTITNEDVTYVAPVTIGGSTWQLIVDTGSSNTWCGAQTSCEQTSTGQSTGNSVSVRYGSGSFSGTEYTDQVSFGGLTVNSQSIGAASQSSGFRGVDGIIGFGPVGLTQGTVANTNTVPTFLDNLYNQGSISVETLGVYFKPEIGSNTNDANGELTLGGVDTTKYTGLLRYFATLKSGTASNYWGIAITNITYGSTTLITSATGIVDTGTTLIYIPTSAYNNFLSATGGTTSSGLASFSTKPTANLNFKFGSTVFPLTPAQYLIPSAQYANFGLQSGTYYAWVTDGGSSGVNTVIGQKFLENYYSVYDTTYTRIGFATRA